jgi:hypothetical protein
VLEILKCNSTSNLLLFSLCIDNLPKFTESKLNFDAALFLYNGLPINDKQIRDSFSLMMTTCMNLNISFSQYRHVANAFANTLDVSNITKTVKMLISEQTGHSSQTADTSYGISEEKLRCLDSTSLNLYFQLSLLWHDWLGIANTKKNSTRNETESLKNVAELQLSNIKSRMSAIESTIECYSNQKSEAASNFVVFISFSLCTGASCT